jgi:predicted nucleotidyltransferase|tara:strand:- start:108 stop:704 length:597 start_codon:yes stop_codon:yes gene_type:complete
MHKAYASYFVSHLLKSIKKTDQINRILLFGSGAKGEANKNSDIDIFIEVNKKTKKLEDEVTKITEDFYKSREALLFKAKGINNKINIIMDKLENWKNLKKSIESTGIQLYGPAMISGKGNKKYAIIHWNKINKNRGAFLNKLYGFKSKNKKYKGLIETLEGEKLGKSCIMIPTTNTNIIEKLLKKYQVRAKIIEVYRD